MGRNRERYNEYQREWYQARRQAWFAENGPCKRCGSWENLELDHIDPSTKSHHRIWSWAKDRREAELAKCQVLCRKCHVRKSIENGDNPGVSQSAKLTWEQVCEIRRQLAEGVKGVVLAKHYGVTTESISAIKIWKTWKKPMGSRRNDGS